MAILFQLISYIINTSGKICINGFFTDETFEIQHNRPVTSIALEPSYSKKASKAFCFGGKAGQLIISSKGNKSIMKDYLISKQKGWFGVRKDNVIHSGEGEIYTIKWRGSLIAWANPKGVKIYDCDKGERITYIERPNGSPRPDLYKCNLCWENDHTLLIGWADSVKIAIIKVNLDP
jgi:WD40 repeat protein